MLIDFVISKYLEQQKTARALQKII